MRWNAASARTCFVALMATSLAPMSAQAGSHTWRVNEVYSSADGSVQFIELRETCGTNGETFLSGHQVLSNANSVNLVNLPPNSSANKHLLLATANITSFGGPTPDYVIPADFFSLLGDMLQYTPYHSCNMASGAVPTNGTDSLNRPAGCSTSTCPNSVATNSPTNFNGETGSVVVGGCIDNDGDDYGDPGDASCPGGPETDCDDTDPDVNPGATEVCDDTVDNNCDGDADCDDATCTGDPACAGPVPTVSQWGMILMALLIMAAATIVTIRRPQPSV